MSDPATKRIAIIGRPGRVEGAFSKTVRVLMDDVGQNTGNLAFWHAISHQVAGERTYFGWDFNATYVRENYDVIIFAAANQLNPGWDLGNFAKRLEETQLPLVVIGLGAQANAVGEQVVLQAGTQRLLALFSERCVRIAMRGDFSASVAESYGAKNVEVIGCPSNFINTWNHELGASIAARMASTTKPYRLVVNPDLHPHLAPTVRRFVGWLEEWGGMMVIQDSPNKISLALGQAEHVAQDELGKIARLMFDRPWDEDIRKFLFNRLAVFFDAEAWMNAVRPSRLSIGTRLHGNILAFQSGVPAIIVPHDSRTTELAQTIGLPAVTQSEIQEVESLPALIASVEFDGVAFDRRRVQLARREVDLLTESGVPVAPKLLGLAAAAGKTDAQLNNAA